MQFRHRSIQGLQTAADYCDMRIPSSPPPTQSAIAAAAERAMLMLKKQQDVARSQGQALLTLIDDAAPVDSGAHISKYG